jgi:hypothetical protein
MLSILFLIWLWLNSFFIYTNYFCVLLAKIIIRLFLYCGLITFKEGSIIDDNIFTVIEEYNDCIIIYFKLLFLIKICIIGLFVIIQIALISKVLIEILRKDQKFFDWFLINWIFILNWQFTILSFLFRLNPVSRRRDNDITKEHPKMFYIRNFKIRDAHGNIFLEFNECFHTLWIFLFLKFSFTLDFLFFNNWSMYILECIFNTSSTDLNFSVSLIIKNVFIKIKISFITWFQLFEIIWLLRCVYLVLAISNATTIYHLNCILYNEFIGDVRSNIHWFYLGKLKKGSLFDKSVRQNTLFKKFSSEFNKKSNKNKKN